MPTVFLLRNNQSLLFIQNKKMTVYCGTNKLLDLNSRKLID